MACKKCKTNSVIELTNNNIGLCQNCFFRYLEKKVLKTIYKYKLIEKKDRIVVGCSGGKDSMSLLYLMNKISKKRDIKLIAVMIDEGIKGYRELNAFKKYCKDNDIECKIYSFKDEFGMPLDQLVKKIKDLKPCSFCGVLRRMMLNKAAIKLKANKVATGHNLDDEAQSIMMNYVRGTLQRSTRLGPMTGIVKDNRFVPRIKPFYFVREKETAAYSYLKNLPVKYIKCPHGGEAFRGKIRKILNDLEKDHKGTKHAIANSFLDLLPVLREKFKNLKIKTCKECGEPASQEVCNTCLILKKLKK